MSQLIASHCQRMMNTQENAQYNRIASRENASDNRTAMIVILIEGLPTSEQGTRLSNEPELGGLRVDEALGDSPRAACRGGWWRWAETRASRRAAPIWGCSPISSHAPHSHRTATDFVLDSLRAGRLILSLLILGLWPQFLATPSVHLPATPSVRPLLQRATPHPVQQTLLRPNVPHPLRPVV